MKQSAMKNSQTCFIGKSATFKLLAISLLALALLIPATMVKSLIKERELRKEAVIDEINAKWGLSQTISGPIISIPYKKHFTDQSGKRYEALDLIRLLPETLDIVSNISPEVRYRGIYESVLYSSEISVACRFPAPDIEDLRIAPEDIIWSHASIGIGISDMRGITDRVEASQDGTNIQVSPGQEFEGLFSTGLKADIILDPSRQHQFTFFLKLNGSQQILFLPAGKTTTVTARSTWKDPSFIGDFLPVERQVSDQGFTAKWNVLCLNRNYPQHWTGNAFQLDQSLFGVKLFKPVDLYQQSMRMAKYALLFIAFAFYAFYLAEILNRLRVHPVQYLLIGFAMIMFYTLQLSVSEHISFNIAYLVAAVAVVSLITWYARSISRSRNATLMVLITLSSLYGYGFILLQLEDYALVMGSIGLFAVLAVIMYLTRRIDWYTIHEKIENKIVQPIPEGAKVNS